MPPTGQHPTTSSSASSLLPRTLTSFSRAHARGSDPASPPPLRRSWLWGRGRARPPCPRLLVVARTRAHARTDRVPTPLAVVMAVGPGRRLGTRRTGGSERTSSPPFRSADHPSRESPRRGVFATDGGAGTHAPLRCSRRRTGIAARERTPHAQSGSAVPGGLGDCGSTRCWAPRQKRRPPRAFPGRTPAP